MATLTGAARVALGPDLPPFYTDDEALAAGTGRGIAGGRGSAVAHAALEPYDAKLSSKIADINNVTTDGFAGSITAALFLQALRREDRELGAFRHLRLEPGRPAARPGRRRGAGIRALERIISKRFG